MSLSTWSGGVVIEYEVNTKCEIFNRGFEKADFMASSFWSDVNYVMWQQEPERQVKGR